MRAFLAIELPDQVKDELVRLQELIQIDGKIKFVERENLHLTLKFFGEVTDEQVEKINLSLKEIKFSPIKTSLKEVGSYPPKQNPRVIWVGLDPSEQIIKLQKEVEKKLQPLGFPEEERAFSAHITIGRVKFAKNPKQVKEILATLTVETIGLQIKDFCFKKSTLTPKGSTYEDLAKFPLE
ncbi:MAG TPA: RNA 2',3'-cyclic phosphodiesterase [Bdellovibrionota bacterium]|nr:RNA 2',3'-cyclic phosphodiesterase [Bdellovibrionota bacterium]